jgi:5-methylcytosine-specific restriction endonuclease McrA
MCDRVKAYLAMLERLSSEDLDRSARELAVREKHEVARLIAHIAEIGERRYHLDLGYPNLFRYCVARLNLSEGSVYRRTQVAAVCRTYPQILEALATGRLHLTGASLIAAHLAPDNVERLIDAAAGKTRREVEELIAEFAPKPAFQPSLRKLPSRIPDLTETVPLEEKPEVAPPEQRPVPSAGGFGRDRIEPASEDRYNLRFSAGIEFADKLKRFAEVMGIESPQNHLEEILGQALEIALEKKDPRRRLERRREREAKRETLPELENRPRPGDAEHGEKTAPQGEQDRSRESGGPAPRRHLPSEVRERVLERAGYQCEYRGPEGLRCTSRTGLEIEHTKPFAVYRSHDERHLRAFCPAHNLQAARKFYGQDFVRRKIEAGRRERVVPPLCGVS